MTPYTYDKLDQPGISEYIFHPTPPSGSPCPPNAEDIHLEVAHNITLHLRIFPSGNLGAPCLLFFHGNGEIVSDYDDAAIMYNKRGITFIAAEYRGYGHATGIPSASTMMTDCHAILDEVSSWRHKHGYKGKLLVMGRSLGSAPAIELAWAHADLIDALLIDSGFAFTLPLLETIGVDVAALEICEDDGFHNLDKIKKISMPTYIIHGQNDEIIALTNAMELIAESIAHQKEFQTVPRAGHNTIMTAAGAMYYDVMGRFIDTIGKVRKKRSGVR
ncbi:MAG: alpha/beta hydrolase [Proteobacteria bacterium]|nr:alpha/beta hydrolase [Pseudomonadota bacterium]MBU1640602.1 alpha/beta hydrolase [Pseudomonadota bacterium]